MKKIAIPLIVMASIVMIASTCLGALQPPPFEYTTEQYVDALPNFRNVDTSNMIVAPDNFDNWTHRTWYLTPTASSGSSITNYVFTAHIPGVSSTDEYYYLVYGWKDQPDIDWDDNEYMLIAVWNVSTGEPTGAILLEFGVGYHDGIIVDIADASLHDLPLKSKFSLSSFSGIAVIGSIIALVAFGVIVYKADKKGKLDEI